MQTSSPGPELRYEPAPEQQQTDDDPAYLQAQASRCRRLARSIGDVEMVEKLARMADELEARMEKSRD